MQYHLPHAKYGRHFFTLFLTAILSVANLATTSQAQEQRSVDLRQFNLLTANSGWVLLDQQLFWTSDVGNIWNEITPPIPSDASIQDVKFIDSRTGWVLWTMTNFDGSSNFHLAHTIDTGKTWTMRSLSLFEMGDIASYVEKAEMDWLDSQTGWISVKQTSGSNFSIGTLFMTSDGGSSWHRSTLPIADKILFSDPRHGWAVGGPTGNQIFNTTNFGATWQSIVPINITNDTQAIAYPPFISDGQGLLIMTTQSMENDLNIYSLRYPDEWMPVSQIKLDSQSAQIGLSILDAQNFVAIIPGASSIVQMENGKLKILRNKDGLSTSIVKLDMVSLDSGWAKSVDSNCSTISLSDHKAASVTCSSTSRLLRTDNGGISWKTINLPNIPSLSVSTLNEAATTSETPALGNTLNLIGQGFDICELPTLSQMQTWVNSSPYKAVNLYIGGSSRACNNSALISSYLFLLYQQGWRFIPTWVGPQAPCTGYASRISNNTTTAYGQGVNEANLAIDRLAELSLTGPDKTGSVVYYDIEYYDGTNSTCRDAVKAFMNGWVSQIHTRGNTAGVYGSTLCNTGLSDFLSIANVPDVIWPARWYHNAGSGYYDPTASVWNLGSCIPNTVWANHQRIRQYEGDHYETWGNLTLNIDSDVLDGVVAIPFDYPFVSSVIRADGNPTNADTVRFTVKFSKPVTGVDKTDFALAATGITGALIMNVSGSGDTYIVTVNTGAGIGTIRLDVVDNDSIVDISGNPLGGVNVGDGTFTSGEVYNIREYSLFLPLILR